MAKGHALEVADEIKWALRRLARRGGWVVRKQPILIDFLRDRKVDLVLDVGANVGQFGAELRRWGYRGRIISFEPGSNAFGHLAHRIAADDRWTARQCAVGDTAGVVTLNVTRSTVLSSIMQQAPAIEGYGSGADIVATENVELVTVDAICASENSRRIFLKIDTQGYEQAVIGGIDVCVEQLCGIQLELPVLDLYDHNWPLPEAIAAMRTKGFELSQVFPVNYRVDDPISVTEIDCVFANRRASSLSI